MCFLIIDPFVRIPVFIAKLSERQYRWRVIAPKPMDTNCVLCGSHKPTDNGWCGPYGSSSTPPGLPSTPQSSWQPCSSTNTTQNSWVFRRHVPRPPDAASIVEANGTWDCPSNPVWDYTKLFTLSSRRSSHTLTTTFRPYEKGMQLGWLVIEESSFTQNTIVDTYVPNGASSGAQTW